MRVAINGFGRIGRLAMRASHRETDIEIVGVNEPACDAATSAHLLEFDSVHGRWDVPCGAAPDALEVDGSRVFHTSEAQPVSLPWNGDDVDVVLECSGRFRTRATLQPFLSAGVGTVLVAAPVKDDALNVVYGVNEDLYDPAHHDIVTASSCTTNCLAPVVKVLHEGIGIEHGSITTLHDMTNTQSVVDAPHEDLRRARAASLSLIPTSTGSATAIGMIFPELEGHLDGLAVRVPLLNSSLTDCVFEMKRETGADEINGLLADAAGGDLVGILGYEEKPLVSCDYRGDPRSSIVDALSTRVTNGTQVKVLAWYDNEWGYANRLVDMLRLISSRAG
ncbi:MAG: ArsJ-associated glyceraldehyde-3-phosphate dehydrogenase [Solirubrobacterales bacterium]